MMQGEEKYCNMFCTSFPWGAADLSRKVQWPCLCSGLSSWWEQSLWLPGCSCMTADQQHKAIYNQRLRLLMGNSNLKNTGKFRSQNLFLSSLGFWWLDLNIN